MSKRARSKREKEGTKPYLGPRRVTVRKMKKVIQDISSAQGPTWMILCTKNQTKIAPQKMKKGTVRIALGMTKVTTTMTMMRKAAMKASREKMNKKKITMEMTKKIKKTTRMRRKKMKKKAAATKRKKKREKKRERQAD